MFGLAITESLVIYLFANAAFAGESLLTFAVLTLMMVTGPLAVAQSTRRQVIIAALAFGMVGLGLIGSSYDAPRILQLALALGVLFFGGLIYVLGSERLMRDARVTGETLWAAISVYWLMGMLFTFVYVLLQQLAPGPFKGGLSADRPGQLFAYFGFVTMTTLGYGDITPDTQIAATLAYVQALIGQLCVVILIARLMSMYSSTDRRSFSDKHRGPAGGQGTTPRDAHHLSVRRSDQRPRTRIGGYT